MSAYYNEFDPYAAQWLRNLIAAGHIAPGDVDERSIEDVQPDDVRGYVQCHFFAGIGGWSYALRLAGWPDARPVWTGSCPCQPFSCAGKGKGFNDSRHLWPSWFRLICECQPSVIFGEQVASADGLAWSDTVSTDLEAEAYAFGSADLPVAGVGGFHIRQRLWWMAYADGWNAKHRHIQRGREHGLRAESGRATWRKGYAERKEAGGLAVSDLTGCQALWPRASRHGYEAVPPSAACIVGNTESIDRRWRSGQESSQGDARGAGEADELGDSTVHGRAAEWEPPEPEKERRLRQSQGPSGWDAADWLPCRDGKSRPVEPGTFPLAHGIPNRVGRLRSYGNAIVPQVAAEFIGAYLDLTREPQG